MGIPLILTRERGVIGPFSLLEEKREGNLSVIDVNKKKKEGDLFIVRGGVGTSLLLFTEREKTVLCRRGGMGGERGGPFLMRPEGGEGNDANTSSKKGGKTPFYHCPYRREREEEIVSILSGHRGSSLFSVKKRKPVFRTGGGKDRSFLGSSRGEGGEGLSK